MAETRKIEDALSGASGIAEYEAFLRKLYTQTDLAIYKEAQLMLERGGKVDDVAAWAHKAREAAKLKIRQWDLTVARKWAEGRNITQYGRAEGPTLKQLKEGWTTGKGVVKAGKTELQIIESAGRSAKEVNKTLGRLRIAGRIFIVFEISLIGYEVAQAPVVDRPKVLIEGVSGLAGAIAGGWAGAEIGGYTGAAIGAWGAGVGAFPGAAVGAIVGGIGGGIAGGFGGRAAGHWAAEQLYPPSQTYFEEVVSN
jgi:hypothetical protein